MQPAPENQPSAGPRRPPRRRAKLSRDAIVEAALRVLDREGASGLSMRRIADELGSHAGALYWHVDDKEELVQLVFDRVIAELPLPEPEPDRWQEQLKQSAREVRDLMRRHPGLAELSFGRIPFGPSALRYIEWQLSVLRAGGLSDDVAALAGDLGAMYVGAFAYEESLGAAAQSSDAGSYEQLVEDIRARFAALPEDEFPNVRGLAAQLTAGTPDDRFEFGLDVIVRGLAARSQGGS